ncbi:MAG: PAS domain S-box protein, partial [Caldilinea sp.]|nr:PAS domain S-box protein [Caldilinea sp.]
AYYVSKQGKAQRLASTEMPEEDPNVPNSAIFVPIKLGEHVRGVMQVFSYHLNAYRQRDLRLVEAIGTQVLVAVNNALLYQKVRQELIARRESEERFRQLAENINEVFWMYDLQIERLTYISPVYETIWPHTAQQAMANPELRYDVILEEDRAQVRATHLRPQHGERAAIEYRLAGADGEIYWMLDQAFPVFDENNAVTRIAGISANITKRKVAEQELRRREAEFKALVENSPDYVARLDPSGRFLYVNPAIAQNAGRALAEFVGKRPGEINLPIDVANLAKLPATVKPLTRIIEIPAGDGETRYVQIRLVPELDGEGRLQSWLSIARDLTDLITAQSKLEELNRTLEQRVVERTKSLAETQRIAHLGSLEVDLERHIAMLSEEAWRILRLQPQPDGLPLEQLSAMVHPDDRERIAEYYANRFEDNVHELEVRIARADGRAAYVSMRAKPIVEDGLVVRVLCTALDITERRMAEQEQRRQTAILEATTDLVAYWNQAGQITYMNAGGRRMLGIAPEVEVASVKLESILTPGGWETLRTEAIERAQRNGIWAGESAIVHAEGMEIPVSQVVIAHRDHNGAVEYFSTIMRDTTLQKQAEEALRRSRDELSAANTALEKAARLKDEFLASMSHELRTPLTSILGLAEALQSKVYGPLNEKQSHS